MGSLSSNSLDSIIAEMVMGGERKDERLGYEETQVSTPGFFDKKYSVHE